MTDATHESTNNDSAEPKLIEGEAVEINSGGALRSVGMGFAGGLVGAGLVAAGFYFLVPNQPGALVDEVAGLKTGLQGIGSLALDNQQRTERELAALKASLATVTSDVAAQNSSDKLAALAALAGQMQSDVVGLQDRLGALDPDALGARLESVDAKLAALAVALDALNEAQLPADLPERIGQVTLSVNTAANQITGLMQRMEAAEAAIARPDPTAEAALGIALSNLARALDHGQSFVAELDAIAALLPEDTAVAALRDVAPHGVQTFSALAQKFAALVDPILVAERQAGREGVWDRLLGNALSIVTVRRVGDVAGDGTEAIVARIETKLANEDLAGALEEAQRLTGAAGDIAQPWIALADARVRASQLVRDLSSRVLSHLATGEE